MDGSGALSKIIDGSTAFNTSEGGTKVRRIVVKATGTTTQGMIRFFMSDGNTTMLLREISVPPVVPSGTMPAFAATLKTTLTLQPGYSLYASTQNGETFNVIAEGINYGTCSCSGSTPFGLTYYQSN